MGTESPSPAAATFLLRVGQALLIIMALAIGGFIATLFTDEPKVRSDWDLEAITTNPEGLHSWQPAVAGTGTLVAYKSSVGNEAPGDVTMCSFPNPNLRPINCTDVIAYSLENGTKQLVSQTSLGEGGNGSSGQPSFGLSMWPIAFVSEAPDLVPNDTNNLRDVFVAHGFNGPVWRVNVGSDGQQAEPARRDDEPDYGTICRAWCGEPAMGPSGRSVVFASWSTNLVDEDQNEYPDVFVRDLTSNQTLRASLAMDGGELDGASWYDGGGNAITEDGRWVIFTSLASNYYAAPAPQCQGSIGERPLGETRCAQVVRKDLMTGRLELLSVNQDGTPFNQNAQSPTMSADGQAWAFQARTGGIGNATRLAVFVATAADPVPRPIMTMGGEHVPNGDSFAPRISADGHFVAFASDATNWKQGGSGHDEIYVYDIHTESVSRVTIAEGLKHPNAHSYQHRISADGDTVVFASEATNLKKAAANSPGSINVFAATRHYRGDGDAAIPAPAFMIPTMIALAIFRAMRHKRMEDIT